jgi:predicted transcriptional regulator
MTRTQVELTDAQMKKLKRMAAGRNVTLKALICDAVDQFVGSVDKKPSAVKRKAMAAAGRFASGRSDVLRSHDEHLAEAFGA